MTRVRRILSVLVQTAVVTAALTAAAIFLAPTLLGWQVATVITGSMAPVYPAAAVVAIAPVDAADVRSGDVIAFRAEADRPMVIHRVVGVAQGADGPEFRTKGDANEDADATPVTTANLRGEVRFGVPLLGYLVQAVRTPVGFAALLVVPGVGLIVREIVSMRRTVRAGRDAEAAGPAVAGDDLTPVERAR